jgi:hypothetical protein
MLSCSNILKSKEKQPNLYKQIFYAVVSFCYNRKISPKCTQTWWYISVIPDTWEAEAGGSQVPGQSGREGGKKRCKGREKKLRFHSGNPIYRP